MSFARAMTGFATLVLGSGLFVLYGREVSGVLEVSGQVFVTGFAHVGADIVRGGRARCVGGLRFGSLLSCWSCALSISKTGCQAGDEECSSRTARYMATDLAK